MHFVLKLNKKCWHTNFKFQEKTEKLRPKSSLQIMLIQSSASVSYGRVHKYVL